MEHILSAERKYRVKDIFILALPAILEMGLNTMLGLADTLMISRIIGTEALSAVGFANQIVFTLIYVFSSFNAGATAMTARSYGQKNYTRMNKILAENLSLNLFLGLIVSVLAFFYAGHIMRVYDVTSVVLDYGITYLQIISYSQVFMFLSFAVAASLRGSGDTRTPMFITGIANILNIIGNYLLITGYSFFPQMGIAGAATATTLSRIVAAALYVYVIFRGNSRLRLHISSMKISRKLLIPLWKLSYAAGLEQLSMQLAFFINGIIISQLDTTSEAAFRILVNIESISFMPAIGISIATATLVGKHLGEERPEESLKTGFTAAAMGVIWGLFMGMIFIIFPREIVSIFTVDSEVMTTSIFTLRVAGINQALLAFVIIMGGALRGAGDTRGVMVITALRLWIIFIPFSYLFIMHMNRGVTGMWYAEIMSFAIFCFIIFHRFNNMKWAKIKMFI